MLQRTGGSSAVRHGQRVRGCAQGRGHRPFAAGGYADQLRQGYQHTGQFRRAQCRAAVAPVQPDGERLPPSGEGFGLPHGRPFLLLQLRQCSFGCVEVLLGLLILGVQVRFPGLGAGG